MVLLKITILKGEDYLEVIPNKKLEVDYLEQPLNLMLLVEILNNKEEDYLVEDNNNRIKLEDYLEVDNNKINNNKEEDYLEEVNNNSKILKVEDYLEAIHKTNNKEEECLVILTLNKILV